MSQITENSNIMNRSHRCFSKQNFFTDIEIKRKKDLSISKRNNRLRQADKIIEGKS